MGVNLSCSKETTAQARTPQTSNKRASWPRPVHTADQGPSDHVVFSSHTERGQSSASDALEAQAHRELHEEERTRGETQSVVCLRGNSVVTVSLSLHGSPRHGFAGSCASEQPAALRSMPGEGGLFEVMRTPSTI